MTKSLKKFFDLTNPVTGDQPFIPSALWANAKQELVRLESRIEQLEETLRLNKEAQQVYLSASEEIDRLEKEKQIAIEALEFYADPNNFAICDEALEFHNEWGGGLHNVTSKAQEALNKLGVKE